MHLASAPHIFQDLVDAGADINAADAAGLTPLHAVVQNGGPAVLVSVLLHHRADVNARANGGQIPLHFCPTEPIAKALHEHAADLAAVDDEGASALHICGRGYRFGMGALQPRQSTETRSRRSCPTSCWQGCERQ